MKKWAIALLALAIASPAFAEEKFGGNSGSYVTPPIASGQIIVSGPDGTFAWYTLAGGNGNCYLQINGPGSVSLICPNFGGGGGGHQVPGGPPQVIGYSTTDQNEAQTFVGDVTLQRTAPNTLTASVVAITGPLPSLQVNGPVGINGPLSVTGNTIVNSITGTTANFSNQTISGVLNFGPSGALYFNGNPMGGTCPDGQFVNTINARGVPACAEPPQGGAVTFVGDAPPPNPVEGLLWFNTVDLQTYIWYNDGTSSQWVAIVNLVPGGGGATDNPVFTGVVTFPDNSTWTSNMVYIADSTTLNVGGPAIFNNTTKFNGTVTFPDGGTWSTSGITVSNVNISGGLTIGGVPIAQLFAPLVNPAGGQNNYAPINNPAFTGTVTIGGLPVATGGPYLPVTSASGPPWTVAGSVNFQSGIALGIPLSLGYGGTGGITASAARLNLITPQIRVGGTAPTTNNTNGDFWYDSASASGLNIYLSSVPGWVPVTQAGGPWLPVNNPTYTGLLTTNGTGYVATFPSGILSAYQIVTPSLSVNGSGTPSACFPDAGCWTSQGIYLTANSTSNYSSFKMGPSIDTGTVYASLGATTGQFAIAQGAYLNASQWYANATAASGINMSGANINFYLNNNLTAGAPFNPNLMANISATVNGVAPWSHALNVWLANPNQTSPNGMNMISASGNVNGDVLVSIMNTDPGTGTAARAGIRLNAGTLNHNFWIFNQGDSFTGQPDSGVIYDDGALVLAAGFQAGVSQINLEIGNTPAGRFWNDDSPRLNGLDLPGFASPLPVNNSTQTGLRIGDGWYESGTYANANISGGAWMNPTNGAWTSSYGAGSGATLLSVGGGVCISMFNHGAVGGDIQLAFTNIGQWCGSGQSTGHISNIQDEPLPRVSSGVLVKGSRDTFGWIKDVKGSETTLTFGEDYEGESNCSLTSAGKPALWFTANQTIKEVTFACVIPWNGEPCADGAIVEYHCFGQGDENSVATISARRVTRAGADKATLR